MFNPTINKIVGASIKRARRGRDMTIAALAKKIGVSPQQVSKYESGKNGMGVDQLCSIADALEVNPCALLPRQRDTQMIAVTPDIAAAVTIIELPKGRDLLLAIANLPHWLVEILAASVTAAVAKNGGMATRGRPRKAKS